MNESSLDANTPQSAKPSSTTHPASSSAHLHKFTPYQTFVISVLAFLQFTIILDFMIISPLGAMLMPALKITPEQFGYAVSVYAFSAGLSGILAAGFADQFDRKRLLLFFYTGFVIGTFCCGIAYSYEFLLVARLITGLFGGVIGSIVMAITVDLFPLASRGRVMGFLQAAFGASQILGLPAGLYFSNLWGWHAPFNLIVFISVLVGVVIWWRLQPVDAHLKLQKKQNPFTHFVQTFLNPRHTLAFVLTGFLSLGGFMLMPFGSDFTVHNLGIPMQHLPLIYLVTGVATLMIGPLVGRAADAYGKFQVFVFGGVLSMITVVFYTHLGNSSLPLVMLVNVVMFVAIFSRMIPSQALLSAIPAPADRGAFMSVSSSLQQIAGGLASIVAGKIISKQANGDLQNMDKLGFIIVGTVATCIALMYFVHKIVPEAPKAAQQ